MTSSTPGWLTRRPTLFLGAIGVAVVSVLLVRSTRIGRPTLRPGSDLFAVIPEAIEFVEYESPLTKVTIARGPTDGSFVVGSTANGTVDRCVGREGVSTILKAISHFRVIRDVNRPAGPNTKATPDHIEIRLAEIGSEGDAWDVDPRLDDPHPVLVSDGKYTWEVDLSRDALRMLRGGCKVLSEGRTEMHRPR